MRRIVPWLIVVLALVAGVVVVDQVIYSQFYFGPLDFLRPSERDLLTGEAARPEREEALQSVTTIIDGVERANPEGSLGRFVQGACYRGSQSFWSQDDYRFSCSVTAYLYIGGTGPYDEAITARLQPNGCDIPLPKYPPGLVPGTYVVAADGSCGNGVNVSTRVALSHDLPLSELVPNGGDEQEVYEDSASTALLDALDHTDWIVVIAAHKQYYRK